MTPDADRVADQVVNSRTIDWPRVARVVFRVRQQYRYDYTGPVTDLEQRLVLIPQDRHGDQWLLDHHLAIRGADGDDYRLTWQADPFGNRIASVRAARVIRAIAFEAVYRVERRPADGAVTRPAPAARPSEAGERPDPSSPSEALPPEMSAADLSTPQHPPFDTYREPTPLTKPDEPLPAIARELAAGSASPRERAERAHTWAARAITYQPGATDVHTPAAAALRLGRGVCQDYVHILLCLLRLMEIPARYVSGHLLGDGAPHAWVEALFEDSAAPGRLDVVAFDPTNHRRVGLDYITVAVGRDFADTSPISGSFRGPAVGTLSATKQADVIEIEYGEIGGTFTPR